MSYKCLHDDLERSDRHAALSDWGCRVWMLTLARTDCRGRIEADAVWLSTHIGYLPFDAGRVEAALQEIVRVGLGHFYEVGGKRYLVFHRAERSCGATGMGKAKPRCPAPPPSLCPCCSGSFQQSDASASGSASTSATSLPFPSVVVQERGPGETKPSAAGESPGSRETREEPPPASFSTDRVAMHLAQRWQATNGKDSRALSSLEKASQAFAMTLKAGVDAKVLEAAIKANPGRSPLDLRDIVLPRIRAAPMQPALGERGEKTRVKTRAEIEAEYAQVEAEEKNPEAEEKRRQSVEKLRSLGIPVEDETRKA